MSKPTVEDILAPKPVARPRIYAYTIADAAHAGLLKVGQTTRDVALRVAEQLKTAAIKNYTIELDELAERDDGSIFSDHEVRAALVKKLHLEWWDCYYVGDCESVEQEMAMHNVTVPSIKEYEEMYGLTFPDGFWDY